MVRRSSYMLTCACSSNITLTPAEYLAYLQQNASVNYFLIPIFVLPPYSYFLTLHAEIHDVWRRKPWSLGTAIFFLSRYLPGVWFAFIGISSQFCDQGCPCQKMENITQMMIVAVALMSQAVFASARIYSIYRRDLKYGILIFVLYTIPIGLRLFNSLHVKYDHLYLGDLDLGCEQITTTELQYQGVTISMNVFQIIADVTAIVLTIRKSLHVRGNSHLSQGKFHTMDFLVQDGSILIGILLLINVIQTIVVLVSPVDFLDILTFEVSCILQCHWITELRQVLLSDDSTSTLGSMSSVRFADRLIGNIGAPLRPVGSSDLDSLDDHSVIFSSDPLSTMLPSAGITSSDQETLLPRRQSSADVVLDDIFDDEEYGRKVLGLMRRKGTTDSVDYHITALKATPGEKERLVSDEEDDTL